MRETNKRAIETRQATEVHPGHIGGSRLKPEFLISSQMMVPHIRRITDNERGLLSVFGWWVRSCEIGDHDPKRRFLPQFLGLRRVLGINLKAHCACHAPIAKNAKRDAE